MMNRIKNTVLASTVVALAACSGSSSDPKTEDRSDLSPPGSLTTVSAPAAGKIELRWRVTNMEEDFKGYHVFGIKGTVADVAAKAKYPAGVDLTSQSIPRCEDNNELFKAFGFTKDNDKGCSGDTATDDKTFVDSDLKAEDEEEKMTSAIPCAANAGTGISYSATPSTKPDHVCVVDKAWNGTALEALAPGQTYTFFVVSVLGDKLNKISWTSNFVQDTLPTSVFSGNVTVKKDKSTYFEFELANLSSTLTNTVEEDCPGTFCRIYSKNDATVTPGKARVYFSRGTNANQFHQRVSLSTPSNGALSYAYRGGQTYDATNPDKISTSIPGDQAAAPTSTSDLGPYISNGVKTVVYGNQVFDLRFVSGSTVNFGKVVVGDPTIGTDNSDADADVVMPVTILIQTKADSLDYLR